MLWQVASTPRRRIRQRYRPPDTRPAESGGPIDLDVGVEAVMRHARYLPPHGSRAPGAFGSFLFQQWRDHHRCKVTARIVPVEWYSTHCSPMFAAGASQAHTITAQIVRPTLFASRAPKMVGWWSYVPRCLLRYQQSWPRQTGSRVFQRRRQEQDPTEHG